MRKMTIGKEVLLTLQRCKHPVTLRRIAGWYHQKSFNSIYQVIYRLKKAGFIKRLTSNKFMITENGRKKLQEL